jgi:hypothetical protein
LAAIVMGDSKVGIICCGVCCCAGLITLIIILATSFHQLDQLELGLNFNSITLQIEDTVYTEAGINFLGPGHYFIRCAHKRPQPRMRRLLSESERVFVLRHPSHNLQPPPSRL